MKQIKAQGTTLYDANDEGKSEAVVQGKLPGIKTNKIYRSEYSFILPTLTCIKAGKHKW